MGQAPLKGAEQRADTGAQEVPLELEEKLSVRVTEHWNSFPGEAVESPFSEILKNGMNAFLCRVLQDYPVRPGRLDRVSRRGAFPTGPFRVGAMVCP